MTDQLKRLTILKKAEIEETDTYRTQIKEDYSNSIWTVLNLNADSKNVNNWEVDMKLKTRYKHSENQHQAMCQQLQKNSRKSSKRKLIILRSNKKKWKR